MRESSIRRATQRLAHALQPQQFQAWVDRMRKRGGMPAFFAHQGEIFVFTARTVNDGEITRRAAALTYHTLLAIVPLLAVAFALFKALGGLHAYEGPLRRIVLENLAVGRAEEVGLWLDKFIANISAGAIAGVGVLLLFYSAVNLLVNSEQAFNRIWGITRGRSVMMRLVVYWAMITIGPVLLGVSISISAQLQRSAFASAVLTWLPWGLGRLLLALGTIASVCVCFFIAYLAVPNTKVHLRPALIGGIVAGLLWSATKAAFFWASASWIKYSAVYGALGALPLLMLWLYASWLIVLFGVTYTYANQTVTSGKLHRPLMHLTRESQELLALTALGEIVQAFASGSGAPTAQDLADRSGAGVGELERILRLLERKQVIAAASGNGDAGYLPARDPHTLTIAEVLDLLRYHSGEVLLLNEGPLQQRARQLLRQSDAIARPALARVTLFELACTEPSEAAPAAASNGTAVAGTDGGRS